MNEYLYEWYTVFSHHGKKPNFFLEEGPKAKEDQWWYIRGKRQLILSKQIKTQENGCLRYDNNDET